MAVRKAATHQIGTPAKEESQVVVDDVVQTETYPSINLLDELQAELSRKAEKPPYVLTVPERPNMSLVFDVNFDYPTFQAWQRKCEDRKTKDTDFYRLSVIVISNTNIGIKLHGQDVERDGQPMLISTPEIHKWLGVAIGGTSAAIRALYGSDGHSIQTARMILEKAGYTLEGDVLEAEDSPLEG